MVPCVSRSLHVRTVSWWPWCLLEVEGPRALSIFYQITRTTHRDKTTRTFVCRQSLTDGENLRFWVVQPPCKLRDPLSNFFFGIGGTLHFWRNSLWVRINTWKLIKMAFTFLWGFDTVVYSYKKPSKKMIHSLGGFILFYPPLSQTFCRRRPGTFIYVSAWMDVLVKNRQI